MTDPIRPAQIIFCACPSPRRDLPILFSDAMIRALLDGRKTQTRRLASSPLAKAQPGDRLWVREAWQRHGSHVLYRADDAAGHITSPWRPSIHMPRWASRLTLVVTAVRRQRLHEISEADAIAEGIVHIGPPGCPLYNSGVIDREGRLIMAPSARRCFASLWDSLHGAGAWESDPEVVAIGFAVRRANIDALHALMQRPENVGRPWAEVLAEAVESAGGER